MPFGNTMAHNSSTALGNTIRNWFVDFRLIVSLRKVVMGCNNILGTFSSSYSGMNVNPKIESFCTISAPTRKR